jgi:Family of unknown function (DUF6459)
MEQIPPPQLPSRSPDVPAGPAVIPTLPTRVLQPGRQAPLPDAVAVRRCPVPDNAPPFDDEALPPADDGPASPANDADDDQTHPGGPADPDAPEPLDGWPSQFAQVLAETLAGSRPARQLTPWTTEQARRRIRQLGPMLATDQRPRVRRLMTSAPAANVLEMTAVVGFGPRVRVLALRLERTQARGYRGGARRWCCTEIESA